MKPKETKPRYVYVTKPTCPSCGEARIKSMQGARAVGDNVHQRQSKCKDCGYCFLVVIEPSREYA